MDRVGAIAPTLSIWSLPALIVVMAFRFETANERWREFLAETDPFLDPSELANPAVAEQHQQHYAELKQKVTELYNGFMSGQIGADVFARELNNAVRFYSDKPVQY